ncbi:MAG: acyloxyacyl hydrolase [Alphaproteobacteria bacterium]|nr:MAG: acyloxyacyl hydrolase [Alphaproteobacteria bacterium]
MRSWSLLSVLGATFLALSVGSAHAAPTKAQPDLIAVGGGYFDMFENIHRKEAADFRLEYRFGKSLLANWTEPYFAIRPFIGGEGMHTGSVYGVAGIIFDVPLGERIVFSPSFAPGLYYTGRGKRIGSFIEFRSQAEVGYRFENESRLTVALSHISNGGLSPANHGAEILSVYYQVPVSILGLTP